MKEEPEDHSIDPELEARIIALVLGEASDFECDELERLMQQDPELRAFKDQVENVNELLTEIGTGELVAEDDDWKLSTKNRNTVLAVLSGEAIEATVEPASDRNNRQQNVAKNSTFLWNLTKIAAVLGIVGIVFNMAMLTNVRQSARRAAGVAVTDSAAEVVTEADEDFEDGYALDTEAFLGEESHTAFGDIATARKRRSGSAGPTPTDFAEGVESESSLAAIRDQLATQTVFPDPHYLSDHVEYAPRTEKFIRPEAPTSELEEFSEAQPRASTRTRIAKDKNIATFQSTGGSFGVNPQEPNPTSGLSDDLVLPELAGIAVSGVAPNSSRQTVEVPDGGTVLLRGNKGYAEFATEPDSSNLSSPSRATRLYSSLDAIEQKSEVVDFDTSVQFERRSTTGQEARDFDVDPSPENDKWGTRQFGREKSPGSGNRLSDSEAPAPEVRPSFGFPMLAQEVETLQRPKYRVTEFDDTVNSNGVLEWTEGEQKRGHQSNDNGLGTAARGGTGGGMAGGGMGGAFVGDRAGGTGGSWYGQTGTENAPVQVPVRGENARGIWVDQNVQPNTQPEGVDQFFDYAADDVTRPDIRPSNEGGFYYQAPAESVSNSTRDNQFSGTFIATDGQSKSPVLSSIAAGDVETEEQIVARSTQGQSNVESIAKKALGKISELNRIDGLAANGRGSRLERFDNLESNLHQTWEFKGLPPQPQSKSIPGKPQGISVDRYAATLEGADFGSNPAINKRAFGYLKQRQIALSKSLAPSGLNEKLAANESFSTFSLHVSDVSFKLARTALTKGQWPDAEKVRIEEFVNAFDYGDPMPSQNEKVSCNLEQCIHPFIQQRNLLRVSMRTAAAGRNSNTPLRLTILLDNSGSMERADRQQTVRRAFALLAQQLTPIDQVTVISFARQPRLLADGVSGAKPNELVQLIQNMPSEGGTNIEAALQLAFEKAQEQKVDNAQNRIVLLTDGAVNLGNANPESLSAMVTTMRNAGIAFDAAGISADGLNDEVLEALTRKGDGRYYLLDSIEAADDGFAKQIAGALRPAAKNVKVQIEFNPQRVGRYKLLGYEKHRLKKEDFRNDKVDAAEMAAAEAGVAVYQFEANPEGEGDIGTVFIRFLDQDSGRMVERSWPIPYEANAPRAEQAAPSLRIATTATLLAAKLRGEPLGESVNLKTLSNLISGLPGQVNKAQRVRDLGQMIEQARQLSGN